MSAEGVYAATVLRDGKEVGGFGLVVGSDGPGQVDIDLAAVESGKTGTIRREEAWRLGTKGYLVLYVSEGRGGFQVILSRVSQEAARQTRRAADYDSRRLRGGDYFVVSLLRPGVYEVGGEGARLKGSVVVAYPVPSKEPQAITEPALVEVSKGELKPAEVRISAGQGIVFSIADGTLALTVRLSEPNDGPGRARVRWTNPGVPRTAGRERSRRRPSPGASTTA